MRLTIALDACTHSIVAFRLTPVAESSVDVAMLLRDVLLPLPMRPDWGPETEWPCPGTPAALGGRAGRVPGRRAAVLRSRDGDQRPQRRLQEPPLRPGRSDTRDRSAAGPGDAAAGQSRLRRAFAGIQSLLVELLLGYRGIGVADRDADPEGDATRTLSEMEHLLATWIVKVWQNRRLDQYAPAWDPGGRHSPNTLFAAAAARDGI